MLAKRMAERHPDDPKAQCRVQQVPRITMTTSTRTASRAGHKFDEVKEVVKFKRKVYYKKYETRQAPPRRAIPAS